MRNCARCPAPTRRRAGGCCSPGRDADAFACIALRPLAQTRRSAKSSGCTCSPAHRGEGWGRRLVAALLAEARAIGYEELKLDTLDWMNAARALYEETRISGLRAVLRQSASRRRLHVAAAARRRRRLTPRPMAHRARFSTSGESAALEQAIAALEAQTGVQLVTAVIGKADSYVELPWKAFALGTALAGLALVVADALSPRWSGAENALIFAVAILGAGAASALLAVVAPPYARLFLRATPPRPGSSSLRAGVFPAPRIVRHARAQRHSAAGEPVRAQGRNSGRRRSARALRCGRLADGDRRDDAVVARAPLLRRPAAGCRAHRGAAAGQGNDRERAAATSSPTGPIQESGAR